MCRCIQITIMRRGCKTNSLAQELCWHWLKTTTPKEYRALLRIMRGHRFLSVLRIGVELIRRIGLDAVGCFFFARPKDILWQLDIIQDIQTDAPDRLMIVAAAACWHTGTRTGTFSTGLMWYLLTSPGLASTKLIFLFLGCNNLLAFWTTRRKTEHGQYPKLRLC